MTSTSSFPWWSKDTIAVVTGANKGIGYETVRQLAQQGLTVVLTARDQGRGQDAVNALRADGQQSVFFHQLDVTNSESVNSFATWLKQQFGGIDILINNAGIARGPNGDVVDYENAQALIDTNYYGVKKVTKALLVLLRPSPTAARIINITSGLSLYQRLKSEKLKQTFREEENYTEDLIDSLATKYLEDVRSGRWKEEGWVQGRGPMYSDSKILMNAYSMVLAASLSESQPEEHPIFLVIVSPGVTMTDLLRRTVGETFVPPAGLKLKTPEEGADTGVWLALLPKEDLAEKHGKIFHDRKEYPFGSGFLNAV